VEGESQRSMTRRIQGESDRCAGGMRHGVSSSKLLSIRKSHAAAIVRRGLCANECHLQMLCVHRYMSGGSPAAAPSAAPSITSATGWPRPFVMRSSADLKRTYNQKSKVILDELRLQPTNSGCVRIRGWRGWASSVSSGVKSHRGDISSSQG
jgi:hypothetical protein